MGRNYLSFKRYFFALQPSMTINKKGGRFLEFAIKSLISTTLVMGTGYIIYTLTVPTEAEMRRRMAAAGRVTQDALNERRELSKKQIELIMENARSNRPIWDVYGETDKPSAEK